MFYTDNKVFLFRYSSGKQVKLYHRKDVGICSSVLNKSGIWLPPMVLAPNSTGSFSADMDKQNNIHVLYQDKTGNISHLLYGEKKWEASQVLKSKKNVYYDKRPEIKLINGHSYCFYIIEHEGSRLLSYQILKDEGGATLPKVVDYIDPNNETYSLIDINNKVYIFYKYAYGTRNQIGYKVLSLKEDQLSRYSTLVGYNMEESNEFVGAAGDENGKAIICWQRTSDNEYQLCEMILDTIEGSISSEKVIDASERPYRNPGIVGTTDRTSIFWTENEKLYYKTSMDNSATWSSKTVYEPLPAEELLPICLKSNSEDEYRDLYFTFIPGNDRKPADLCFISDMHSQRDQNGSKNFPNEQTKYSVQSVEEILNRVARIEEKLSTWESVIKHKELQKTVITEQAPVSWEEAQSAGLQSVTEETCTTETEPESVSDEKPIMEGAGFATITVDFLNNLSSNKGSLNSFLEKYPDIGTGIRG